MALHVSSLSTAGNLLCLGLYFCARPNPRFSQITAIACASILHGTRPYSQKCLNFEEKHLDIIYAATTFILMTTIGSYLGLSRKTNLLTSFLFSGVQLGSYKLASFISRKPAAVALHETLILIDSDSQKGSGVLVKDGKLGHILMTVKHVVTPGSTAYIEGIGISLDRLKRYESGSDILLFVLPNIFENQETIPLLVNAQLQIGEKVYFGGYPFRKTAAHLNQGYISSIGQSGKFSIDGVAVAGMSGGPIVVERAGKFYVIGTIASETFDPAEGFSGAVDQMHCDHASMQATEEFTQSLRESTTQNMLSDPQFTKIRRGQLVIGRLERLKEGDPECFNKMWDDLNQEGVISDDGGVDPEKVIPGQLGLREEYQQYEDDIITLLRKRTPDSIKAASERIEFPFEIENPIDSVNTVGLSLVQSLSTGLITGHLLQEYCEVELITHEQESAEFEIGKKKRDAKNKKKMKSQARSLRAEAKQSDSFVNTGIPPILYRFVSRTDARRIKQNGILHSGEALDEIPFLTKPLKKMALSVGAVSTDRLVAIYTDKIQGLLKSNVGKVSERNGVVTYRINVSIPKDAIEVFEA